ncbi:MAG: hypothetical protein AAB740_02185 [Patescibacteria group bacterium]
MEFTTPTEKLAEIRLEIVTLVEQINVAASGEPFYARIILENCQSSRRLTGLISNLRVNEYKLIFDFTEDRLIEEKLMQDASEKEVKFEKLRGIEVFQTRSGKPMFLSES